MGRIKAVVTPRKVNEALGEVGHASQITVEPIGEEGEATDVQGALEELEARIAALEAAAD